jgi:hypothetical protein
MEESKKKRKEKENDQTALKFFLKPFSIWIQK